VRRLVIILAGLLAGCGDDREGMVLMLDPSLRAEIVLDNADGIAAPDGLLWHEGTLYIADEGGSAVRAWTPGKPVRTLADDKDGFSSPEDLVRDPQGNLYVTDDDTGGVWRISPAGEVIALPHAAVARSTEGLALSAEGSLMVGDQQAQRLLAIGPDRGADVVLARDRGVRKPESLAFDGGGDLYIADNADHILYRLGGDGTLSRVVADREGFSPESLHFTGSELYITDSEHGVLYRYSERDGLAAIAVFTGDLFNVQGITSDGAGNLFVSVQSDLDNKRGYVLRLKRARATKGLDGAAPDVDRGPTGFGAGNEPGPAGS
jgi:sugar lactone lactonase YvrE